MMGPHYKAKVGYKDAVLVVGDWQSQEVVDILDAIKAVLKATIIYPSQPVLKYRPPAWKI